jgi:hypothetical protein
MPAPKPATKPQPESEPPTIPMPNAAAVSNGVRALQLLKQTRAEEERIFYTHAFRHPRIQDGSENDQKELLVVLLHPNSCDQQNLRQIGDCLQEVEGTWGEILICPELCSERAPTVLTVIPKVHSSILDLTRRVNEHEDTLAIVVRGFWAIASYGGVPAVTLTIGFREEEVSETDPASILYELVQKLCRSFRFVHQGQSIPVWLDNTADDIRRKTANLFPPVPAAMPAGPQSCCCNNGAHANGMDSKQRRPVRPTTPVVTKQTLSSSRKKK